MGKVLSSNISFEIPQHLSGVVGIVECTKHRWRCDRRLHLWSQLGACSGLAVVSVERLSQRARVEGASYRNLSKALCKKTIIGFTSIPL